jgi:hypothetical protein
MMKGKCLNKCLWSLSEKVKDYGKVVYLFPTATVIYNMTRGLVAYRQYKHIIW